MYWIGLILLGMITFPIEAKSQEQTVPKALVEDAPTGPQTPHEVAGIPESLNLQELLQVAEENNPTLVEAASVVDMTIGNQLQVGLYPNPILYYNGANITKSLAGQQGGLIEQRIVTGGKLKLNRAIAAQTVNQATWLQQQQILRVSNTVRLRYYEILGAQRQVELAESLQSIAERAAIASRQLLQSGEGTRPDVLQAEIEVGQAEIILNNSRNQYLTAWKQLAATMGMPEMQPVPLDGTLDDPPLDFDWDTTVAWLTSNSPEVMVAQCGLARAQISIRRAQVEPWPNVDVQGWVQRDTQVNQNVMQAQVAVPTPIFNRNQGGIYSAVAAYRRAQATVQQVDLSLRDRLSVAYRGYRNARQQVENYRTKILPKAKESLELIREGYRRGELTFLQVLFAQRTYFQTNLAYVEALTQLWKSSVAISGMLITETTGPESTTVPSALEPASPTGN